MTGRRLAGPDTRRANGSVSSAFFGTTRNDSGRSARLRRLDEVGLVGEVVLNSAYASCLGRGAGSVLTCGSALSAFSIVLHLRLASRSTFMKISSSTPPLHCCVPWSTLLDSSRMPPNSEQRHRDGDDAGDRHQQVAAQRDQRLAREVREARPHRVSSRRRTRRAPGRGRACRGRARSRAGASRRRCVGRGSP